MSTNTPLRVLLLFVLRLIPYLSFSNPPLPLRNRKGIFLFLCLGLTAGSVWPATALAETISFGINTAEGGITKPRYVTALESWLVDKSCQIKVTAQVQGSQGDLVFDLRNVVEAKDSPLLRASGISSTDLNSVWLIKRVSLGGGVASLKGERVALLSKASKIGYQRPIAQLASFGVATEDLTVLHSDQYQGVMTLLLHGDVFAAAVPRVFATLWMEPNDLAMLIEDSSDHRTSAVQAGIWLDSEALSQSSDLVRCIQALSQLNREGRRDVKMRLFPEWVSGFTLEP
ncbi:PhnD/SsuA/transferrin family substrate-binding protein [Litoribrevibacter euphylliae]|uniref:PhnD/SsuA/transferrin family substrate-binding protein n=1 Tax=Litoribrevibacter euphylliae TaxID=1834034 RepID=A0ABV7HDZ5_9GAMM